MAKRGDVKAIKCVEDMLNNVISKLQKLKQTDESTQILKENYLMDYADNRLALNPQTDTYVSKYQITENCLMGAEQSTLCFLRTYNLMTNLIGSNHQNDGNNYDYSVMSLYFGKMFETELSLSIVQQMRQAMGIPMPGCFNKQYRSDESFKVLTDERYNTCVDLNEVKNKAYNAPSIGQAYWAYIKMLYDMRYSEKLIRFEDVFLYIWNGIREERNMAAHKDLVTFADFERIYNHFRVFLAEYFARLMELKYRLKRNGSIPDL
jgi:hypothetical protein